MTFHAILRYGKWGVIGLVAFFVTVLLVCFLGGLASAILEARRERAAGLPVSRPARELKAKRQAVGGWHRVAQLAFLKLGHRGMKLCWCGRGPLQHFPALDAWQEEGIGCAAWELGDPEAIRLHDAAGGYRRQPATEKNLRRVGV